MEVRVGGEVVFLCVFFCLFVFFFVCFVFLFICFCFVLFCFCSCFFFSFTPQMDEVFFFFFFCF